MRREADWWSRLEVAFHGAIDLPPGDRAAYLDRVCGADVAFRSEVDAMLQADAPERALGIEWMVQDDEYPDPFIGMRLGAWRIIDLLGRGGMGAVYLAERADGQYEQRVALKIVHVQSEIGGVASRFQAERHILARVSHPNIARLLDAGLTPEGSAFLVMELVEGSPITAYCDEHRLTVDARLRLFQVVANAIQQAHQSLVVHRDLKPANILVSRAGEVKLLDFGIAKLLEPDQPTTRVTAREFRLLTPGYAAPEQVRGEPITTATDVYVLGIVLYELLTGMRPDEAGPSTGSEPLAPSQAVSSGDRDSLDRSAVDEIAAARGTTGSRLVRLLAGDVDRVVLKALKVEPERRYGSAAQLSDDISRLLEGRPVVAQPDTWAYRTRRFVGRHRLGVAMATALFGLSSAFALVAGFQARAIAAQRDRATVEARRAERVSLLAADLFRLAEPAVGRGETITARELLDQASVRVGSELQGDTQTQAALFNVLGRVYANLGLNDRSIAVLERALELQRHERQGSTLAEAETLHRLGEGYVTKGDLPAAERRLNEALVLRRQLNAPLRDLAATLEALGRTLSLTGRLDTARPLLEEAIALGRSQRDVSNDERMSSLYELGSLLHETGDFKRAESLFREAVDIGRSIAEPSPIKVTGLMHLARFVQEFERSPAKAEPLYREALDLARTIYAGDHQQVADCLSELARNLEDLGRSVEAESFARESVAMCRRLYGDRHDETIIHIRVLARSLRAQAKLDEAERLTREAVESSRAVFGEGNPGTFAAARELANVLEDQKRFAEARRVRQTELENVTKAFGPQHVYVAIALTGLGRHCLIAGQIGDAEDYFRKALDVRERIHPPGHWRIDEAHVTIGSALVRAGRFQDAEQEMVPAFERLSASRGATADETNAARKQIVALYERWNRLDEASRYGGERR